MNDRQSLRSRAEEILDAALELPAGRRDGFLDRECAGQPELRALVEKLLSYADDDSGAIVPGGAHAGDLWDTPPEDAEETQAIPSHDVPPAIEGASGRYRLLRKLGEGGMGEVFEAEQAAPVRRHVAIKIVKRGMDSRQVVARFEAERQALALMDHPNVAHVFDAGTTQDGRPFFAMELVPGEPITAFCDRHALPLPERLRLFVDVCDGVQHAHRCTIIHRDLKPSNILVVERDGRPVPKIIDFGVAKATVQPLTEKTLFTALGQFVGTPAYMSPEQADLSGSRIDTRTDVYSLGAVLYELLVGVGPLDPSVFAGSPLDEVLRTVQTVDPPRPSTRAGTTSAGSDSAAKCRGTTPERLSGQLRGDLDWITMKALEKDRERRYGSPSELAADIERFLRNEAVAARPPSARYRLGKFVRRNTLAVGAGAAFLVLLVGFAAAMTVMFESQRRERQHAETERDKAESITSFLQDMLASVQPSNALGREVTVDRVLDEASLRVDGEFARHPEVRAALHSTIGKTYAALGRFDASRPHLEAALAARQEVLPPDHPDVAASRVDLADELRGRGENAQAEALACPAIESLVRTCGAGSVEVAEARGVLALAVEGQGRLEEAEQLHREVLATLRSTPGEEARLPRALGNLSNLLLVQGRYDEAAELSRQSLDLLRASVGENHPTYLEELDRLAILRARQGAVDDAIALSNEAIAGAKRVHGPEHPLVATMLNNLGSFLQEAGRVDESIAMQREVLALRRRVLPEDHPDLGYSMNNLAAALSQSGEWDEAEALYREALALRRRIFGPTHPQVAVTLSNLGAVLRDRGRLDEAEPLLREALELRKTIHGPRSDNASTGMSNLARLLQQRRRYEEAEALLRETVAIRREALGNEHPRTGTALGSLGMVLRDRGDHPAALETLREALEIARRTLGPEDAEVGAMLEALGTTHVRSGTPEEGEPLLREAVRMARATLPEGHPRRVSAVAALGRCLRSLGRYEEAETLLLDAYRAVVAKEGEASPRARQLRTDLTELHAAWGRPDRLPE